MKQVVFILTLWVAMASFAPTQILQRKSPAFSTPITNGLLTSLSAYWKLDETSDGSGAVTRSDSSGNGLTLNDTNTTASATGILNNGADFEFSNLEVLGRPSSDNSLALATNVAVSVSAWVNLESTNATRAVLAKDSTASNNREYSLFHSGSNGKWTFAIGRTNSSTVDSVTNTTSVVLGTWYHLVGTWDPANDTIKLYVNNSSAFSASKTIDPPKSAIAFTIGATAGSNQMDGIVDEVAVWRDRVLTATDVSVLYNGGTPLPFSSWTN